MTYKNKIAKVTKALLKVGMVFVVDKPLDLAEFKFDGKELALAPRDYMTLETNEFVHVTALIKKYRTGHGYSGEMVRFRIGEDPKEYVSFWSDFKAATTWYTTIEK